MSEKERYSAVAAALHWVIAIAIIFNILIGWWMHDAIDDPVTRGRAIVTFQLHKSIGLTVLLLSLARLSWRFTHPVPALPAAMPAWEKLAARAVQWGFYALMIALPMSGWVYVSAGWSADDDRPVNVPTLFWGLFKAPHLFGLDHADIATRRGVAGATMEAHELMAWLAIALLALHVAGAVKHHFFNRDGVLASMVPGLKPLPAGATARQIAIPAIIMALIGLIVLAAGARIKLTEKHEREHAPAHAEAAAVAPTPEPLQPSATPALPSAAPSPAPALEPAATAQLASAPAPAAIAAWQVNAAASEIAFTGVHAGTPFRGTFSRWRADIRFDPDHLDQSRATVTIETGSGSDGNSLHDQSLPTDEWFDVAHHPTAVFRTTRITHASGNSYSASGALTIKDHAIPVSLPFTLTINGDHAVMSGRAHVDRRAANLGMETDPDAEYVSREIGVEVRVEATRAR